MVVAYARPIMPRDLLGNLSLGLLLVTVACSAGDKVEDGKGVVDDSPPPSDPSKLGKADGASAKVVAVDLESAHPYANDANTVTSVPFSMLPSCANRARVHFKVLATEPHYDFVTIEPAGGVSQPFEGSHPDTWSAWFDLLYSADHFDVHLTSDGSVTRQGFHIDRLEWDGAPICSAIAYPACAAGTADVTPPRAECACPVQPVCAPITSIAVSHGLTNGHNRTAHSTAGLVLSETHPGPTDAAQTTVIGTVAAARLASLVTHAAQSGMLASAGYAKPVPSGQFTETFSIATTQATVTFVAPQGGQTAAVASLAAEFDALARCTAPTGGTTCESGFACNADADTCEPVATACTCPTPAADASVCGVDGHTYPAQCDADCAAAPVKHAGACGAAGDPCGTLFGLVCAGETKCRFGTSQFIYPFPDAGGTCVPASYCDAASDCTGPHPAVLGAWACSTNTCSWTAGVQWMAVSDGAFATAHPYASSTSTWKELYLPAGAQAMRVLASAFALESGYDFLEVWSWTNGAWVLDHRYTGTVGPAPGTEFTGRYHYLHFVSDISVNKSGFTLTTEWR